MINWPMVYDWFRFWLPICLGIAICLFFLIWAARMFITIKRERQVSRDVMKAYRYFKHLVEQDKKERGDE